VGREIVRALRAKNMRVRASDRDPSRVREAFGADLEAVRLDFRDPSTFAAAAEGARGLFLLRPPAIADVDRTLHPLVDEARRRGVKHVVFLSVAGAGTNKLVPHHAVERHLARASGWTVLRPGFFAQNLGDAYRRDIVEDARVYVPAGRGRVAFVDVRDLAELAATIFASPAAHEACAYTLTGPEAVDFATVASILSEAIGRPIRYEPASIVGYVLHLRARGMPWAQLGVQMVLHAGLRLGQAEHVDPTLERLLGHRPRTVRDYVRDHRALWDRQGAQAPRERASVAGLPAR
jgi:uncharacterized protein YbjT (DUF2867 family)